MFINKLFYNLNISTIKSLPIVLEQPTPDKKTSYENSAIFENLNAKKVVDQLFKNDSEGILFFDLYFQLRYFSDYEKKITHILDHHKPEITFWSEFLLLSKKSSFKKIKKYNIDCLASNIEFILKKLKSVD
ncbi:MAG: hypothetical protein KAR21_22950 [Spirochaetales bacterium]|nr:hypothetical protein [Spirochaetales bacterium]